MEKIMKSGPEPGLLPQEGMLASTYIPYQKMDSPRYSTAEAIKNGTLYPGLNLPYRHFVPTKEIADTSEGQLMSIDFALQELSMYLDTHTKDQEALTLYNKLVQMSRAATAGYEKDHGPLTHKTEMDGEYTWINGPWPWEK